MSARQDFYIDTYARALVAGPLTVRAGSLPYFVQGDTLTWRIYLLERLTTYPDVPYGIVNNAALSLKAALGPKDGQAGSALYTQQFTWTADAQNQYFEATFPMNTAGIASLLGSAASATAWLEIKYYQDAVPTTVFQQQVTVNAEVIETTPLSALVGDTAVPLAYAEATYLKAENEGFVLVNRTTGARLQLYLADDNSPQWAPVT
jgi:hypothetical protein